MPLLRPALALALTLGCGPDPRQTEAQRYVESMGSVVAENAALARRTMELAEGIQKRTLDAPAAAKALESEVLPRARLLESRARAVMPTTPALAAGHQQLVDGWSARADAYADLARAWHASDLSAFDAATRANREASDEAAEGLEAINGELAHYGLEIDPFPSGGAKAPGGG